MYESAKWITPTGATSGAGTVYSGFLWDSCYSIARFMCMSCRSLFDLFMAIVLSVRLRFTDYDYPFGIFKLFMTFLSKIQYA